jgi:mannose-6-phosphate isomerase
MVALSEFWLLHGFKQEETLRATLASQPEFVPLLSLFDKEGYKGLYKSVMELHQVGINELLLPLVKRELGRKEELTRNEPGYWVAKLYEGSEMKNIDRGIFSIYFFNIVQVQPGEAIFQGAGIPHAYLQGQNVELMANSDNVLRGGLTPKHIDVTELMKHTLFEGIDPSILKGAMIKEGERNYPCPVPDFGISAIELTEGEVHHQESFSGETYLIAEGSVKVDEGEREFKRGEAFYVLPATSFSFQAIGNTLVYKAFVPV